MALAIGQTLQDRYRIDAVLGAGGMGAVYRAYDTRLQQDVAIKENAMAMPESRKQFEWEALMLARMRHPNLPRVTDHLVTPEGAQYLVMDYIAGEDLAEIVTRAGPLPEAQAIAWVSQVCSALEYLHSQQPPIIHRDIKPQNIKVTPAGQVFLVDFGLAKLGATSKTVTGALGVTPGFSPPEQYGTAGTDQRSDIYALAATLYAILTGHVPTESITLVTGEAELVPPATLQPGLSPHIEQAILKAMDTRKTGRPGSVAEFRRMLCPESEKSIESVTPFLTQWPGAADTQMPAAPGVTPTLVRPVSKPRLPQVPPKREDRKPFPWVIAGAASVVVVGAIVCLAALIATARQPRAAIPLPTATQVQPTSSPFAPAEVPVQPTDTLTPSPTAIPPSSTPARPIPSSMASATSVPPSATPVPISTPVLISPGDGETVGFARFRWKGSLSPGQAFVLTAVSDEDKSIIASPPLQQTTWDGNLPAAKSGGWSWSVSVVNPSNGRVMAKSNTVHFWYQPILGAISPLATPPKQP